MTSLCLNMEMPVGWVARAHVLTMFKLQKALMLILHMVHAISQKKATSPRIPYFPEHLNDIVLVSQLHPWSASI